MTVMLDEAKLPANYCRACFLVHPPMETCQGAAAAAMLALLGRVGNQGVCSGCTRPIFWVTHRNGAKTPYTESGLNHFIDCPARDSFKRAGK
jgi:hypothetical protein